MEILILILSFLIATQSITIRFNDAGPSWLTSIPEFPFLAAEWPVITRTRWGSSVIRREDENCVLPHSVRFQVTKNSQRTNEILGQFNYSQINSISNNPIKFQIHSTTANKILNQLDYTQWGSKSAERYIYSNNEVIVENSRETTELHPPLWNSNFDDSTY